MRHLPLGMAGQRQVAPERVRAPQRGASFIGATCWGSLRFTGLTSKNLLPRGHAYRCRVRRRDGRQDQWDLIFGGAPISLTANERSQIGCSLDGDRQGTAWSNSMRVMNLPGLDAPDSAEAAIAFYKARLQGTFRVPLPSSFMMLAYLAWPNDEQRRNSWMATSLARLPVEQKIDPSPALNVLETFGGLKAVSDPAFESLVGELTAIGKKWAPVADVFMRIVDMSRDNRLQLRGGPSISKAIGLCEFENEGRSHAQLYRLWKQFHDVAHLIAAGAYLAGCIPSGPGRSIFSAIWYAPDAVLGIAAGFEQFGLGLIPHGQRDSVLPAKTTWRLPSSCCPQVPFLIKRQLSDSQVDFLKARLSPKAHISKP
jgi:hypothetical protein